MSVVTYERKDHIAYLTMNRPEKQNALDRALMVLTARLPTGTAGTPCPTTALTLGLQDISSGRPHGTHSACPS